MAHIHEIREFDIENDFGTGPVTSVFYNYCPFHCKGCWNEETWERKEELYLSDETLVQLVVDSLESYNMHKDLSILGGDPLAFENVDSTLHLVKEIKRIKPNTKIGIWTGFMYEQLRNQQIDVLNYIDYLIDGRYDNTKKVENMRYGSYNQRVIDCNETRRVNKIALEESYFQENKEHLEVEHKDQAIYFINFTE